MSAYLIEVSDTKEGVLYPSIVGPFPDEESADEFARKMQMGEVDPFDGGYAAVHVVSDMACHYTPDRYRQEFSWRIADEEEDD